MRMSPEIAIFILFRRCLRPQARFGAQPPLAAALSAKMRRNSARLVSRFRKFFDTLKDIAVSSGIAALPYCNDHSVRPFRLFPGDSMQAPCRKLSSGRPHAKTLSKKSCPRREERRGPGCRKTPQKTDATEQRGVCAGGKKPTARSIKQDFETFLKVSKSAQRGEKTFSTRWPPPRRAAGAISFFA